MRLGFGARDHHECPHRISFDYYSSSDSSDLDIVIKASYRHVFGRSYVMHSLRTVAFPFLSSFLDSLRANFIHRIFSYLFPRIAALS